MRYLSIPLLILVLLLSACTKIAFVAKKPKENSALVYVYSLPSDLVSDADTDSTFKLHIDGKRTSGYIKDGEYNAYDLKVAKVNLTITRAYLERKSIDLDLKNSEVYYLKVKSISNGFGKFEFTLIDEDVALKELGQTTLAGKYEKESGIINSLLGSETDDEKQELKNSSSISEKDIDAMVEKKLKAMEKSTPKANIDTPKTGSKLEEIRKAYEMKKEGLLSQDEFLQMKSEILAK